MFSPFRAFGPNQAEGQAQGPAAAAAPQGKPQSRDEKVRQLKASITKLQEELRGLIQ